MQRGGWGERGDEASDSASHPKQSPPSSGIASSPVPVIIIFLLSILYSPTSPLLFYLIHVTKP